MQTPWMTDRWFTSPHNFNEEVRAQLKFAKKITFHDITLRDGEQQTGVVFTKDDKIRIAEKLAEAGVHRIEAGMPTVSKADEAAIREIVKRKLGPKIFAFSRCMVADIQRAVDCGVEGVVVEIPSRVAARPSATFAVLESAPYDMPAMVIGTRSSIGLLA